MKKILSVLAFSALLYSQESFAPGGGLTDDPGDLNYSRPVIGLTFEDAKGNIRNPDINFNRADLIGDKGLETKEARIFTPILKSILKNRKIKANEVVVEIEKWIKEYFSSLDKVPAGENYEKICNEIFDRLMDGATYG